MVEGGGTAETSEASQQNLPHTPSAGMQGIAHLLTLQRRLVHQVS